MINNVLTYKGTATQLPDFGELGDVVVVNNIEYVYCKKWKILGGNYNTEKIYNSLFSPRITNCVNCGAVIKYNYCEYCGTIY